MFTSDLLYRNRLLVGAGLLIVGAARLLCQPPSSARDVLTRFCNLDVQGEQLSPEGWQKVAKLFTMPGAPPRDKITVVRDFVVSNPTMDHRRTQFYVEYIELGRVDASNGRFSIIPAVKVRAFFDVITASGGKSDEQGEWRIAGSVPQPRVTVDTAMRYVAQLRENSIDPIVKKNADRTLATLRRYR